MQGRAIGGGSARTAATVVDALGNPLQSALSDSQAASTLDTTAYGNTEIEVVAESESEVPMLIPIMGEELSSVQFLSLDEQRFEADGLRGGHGRAHCPALSSADRELKLCREHGTYVPTKTLAFAIHHVLQDDTELLIKELSAYVTGKRERE